MTCARGWGVEVIVGSLTLSAFGVGCYVTSEDATNREPDGALTSDFSSAVTDESVPGGAAGGGERPENVDDGVDSGPHGPGAGSHHDGDDSKDADAYEEDPASVAAEAPAEDADVACPEVEAEYLEDCRAWICAANGGFYLEVHSEDQFYVDLLSWRAQLCLDPLGAERARSNDYRSMVFSLSDAQGDEVANGAAIFVYYGSQIPGSSLSTAANLRRCPRVDFDVTPACTIAPLFL